MTTGSNTLSHVQYMLDKAKENTFISLFTFSFCLTLFRICIVFTFNLIRPQRNWFQQNNQLYVHTISFIFAKPRASLLLCN